MGCLLFLAVGAALWFGGDQVSAYCWPAMDPSVGHWVLFGGFVFVSMLLWSPTRFISQAAIMGTLTLLLTVGKILAQGLLAVGRLMWSSGRSAFVRLMGGAE